MLMVNTFIFMEIYIQLQLLILMFLYLHLIYITKKKHLIKYNSNKKYNEYYELRIKQNFIKKKKTFKPQTSIQYLMYFLI